MTRITRDEFMSRYNDGRGLWAKEGGEISCSETRLSDLKGTLNPDASFVRDMGELSDEDFRDVAAAMGNEAKIAYLYNKYPDFFSRIDNGDHGVSVTRAGADLKMYPRDGKISAVEISNAVGGKEALFVAALDAFIIDPRDRWLLQNTDIVDPRSVAAESFHKKLDAHLGKASPLASGLQLPGRK